MVKCPNCERNIERLPCQFCGELRQLRKAIGYPEKDPPKSTSETDPEE